MMFNIVEALENKINQEPLLKSIDSKSDKSIYFYPSQAMCYSDIDGCAIGACVRQVWLEKNNEIITNPKSSYNNFIFEAGHLWEGWLTEKYKELGIYLDNSVKIVDNEFHTSCELDIVHKNPIDNSIEVTECKQYNGSNIYAAKDLLGTDTQYPRPKDQNLLQCVKYLLTLQKYNIQKINLLYLDRSCSGVYNNKQFVIYLDKHKIYYDTLFKGKLLTVEEERFTTQSLIDKETVLLQLLEEKVCPAVDYYPIYTKEIIEKEFKLGNLTKTRHKQLQENKIPMEDEASWQCKYCPYWKNRETGESTCLNYGVNFEN